MFLLAISGGPDSMVLLNKYRKHKIIVAHVNYHARSDSDIDEKLVKDFCQTYNIKFEVLNVKSKPTKNFQSWARDIRYTFFKKIYDSNNCDKLITAHHIDDFLETAIMQQESGRTPKQFGMPLKSNVYNMNIYRPFIDLYWKHELLQYLKKKNINYAIDSSNGKPIYTRNKIRMELSKLTFKEKKDKYKWFLMSNKILKKKNRKIKILYSLWQKGDFKASFLKTSPYKSELVFELIHSHFENIKLSTSKIESIIDFIIANNGTNKYKLNYNSLLILDKGKVKFRV